MKDQRPCVDWAEQLAVRHPEDLSLSEQAALNKHIESCTTCANVRKDYDAMTTRIRAVIVSEPPLELAPHLLRFRERIAEERMQEKRVLSNTQEIRHPLPSSGFSLRGAVIALVSLAWLILVLSGILSMNGRNSLSSETHQQAPTVHDLLASLQAALIVKQYYTDWNLGDYQGAYNLLGTIYQEKYSFSIATRAYTQTLYNDIQYVDLEPLASSNNFHITLIDNTTELTTFGGTVFVSYRINHIVGKENGNWKILASDDPRFSHTQDTERDVKKMDISEGQQTSAFSDFSGPGQITTLRSPDIPKVAEKHGNTI